MAVSLGGLALAGGIAATASHVNSMITNHYNHKNRQAQISADKELMSYQNSLNRQYLLDSPSMTVEGLRKAGLSPLSSQGSFTQAGNTSIANVGTPSGSAPKFELDPVSISQLDLNESQKNANDQLARVYAADASGKEIDNQTKADKNIAEIKAIYSGINLNDSQISEILSNIDKINQDIVESASRVSLNQEQVNYLQTKGFNETWDMLLKNEKLQHEINLMVAQTHMSNAQAMDLVKKVASGYYESLVNANNAGAAASRSQVGLNVALAGQAGANTAYIKSQTFGQDLKNIYTSGTVDGAIKAANAGYDVDGSKFVRWTDKVTTWVGTIGGTIAKGVNSAAAAAIAF